MSKSGRVLRNNTFYHCIPRDWQIHVSKCPQQLFSSVSNSKPSPTPKSTSFCTNLGLCHVPILAAEQDQNSGVTLTVSFYLFISRQPCHIGFTYLLNTHWDLYSSSSPSQYKLPSPPACTWP